MKRIWLDDVSIGQEITINGEKYICQGIVLCNSNDSDFCEFMLYSRNQNHYKWLEVELIDNLDYELYLYSEVGNSRYNTLLKNEFTNSDTYSNKATVIRCRGNYEADVRETYEFTEYYKSEKVLCMENWSGEVEYSYGKEIVLDDVILGDVVEYKSENFKRNSFNSKPKKPFLVIGLVVAILLSAIALIPSRAFSRYCSPTCSRNHKDICCINVSKCIITNKVCKSMYSSSSRSVRYRSSGSRNPVGGGTSFGK